MVYGLAVQRGLGSGMIMKTLFFAIALATSLVTHPIPTMAQGVISDDAAIFPLYGSEPVLTLTKSLQGRVGLFAISIFSNSPSQYTFSASGIAELYSLLSVTAGMSINPAFISGNPPLLSNSGIAPFSSDQTFNLGQSRYYAYWDDRYYDSGVGYGIPDFTDNYGWVQITRTVSGLRVTASATAMGQGIIAGTLTQIPEPTAVALAFVAWACFHARLLRRHVS